MCIYVLHIYGIIICAVVACTTVWYAVFSLVIVTLVQRAAARTVERGKGELAAIDPDSPPTRYLTNLIMEKAN